MIKCIKGTSLAIIAQLHFILPLLYGFTVDQFFSLRCMKFASEYGEGIFGPKEAASKRVHNEVVIIWYY
jgi:hypothetical protein